MTTATQQATGTPVPTGRRSSITGTLHVGALVLWHDPLPHAGRIVAFVGNGTRARIEYGPKPIRITLPIAELRLARSELRQRKQEQPDPPRARKRRTNPNRSPA